MFLLTQQLIELKDFVRESGLGNFPPCHLLAVVDSS